MPHPFPMEESPPDDSACLKIIPATYPATQCSRVAMIAVMSLLCPSLCTGTSVWSDFTVERTVRSPGQTLPLHVVEQYFGERGAH